MNLLRKKAKSRNKCPPFELQNWVWSLQNCLENGAIEVKKQKMLTHDIDILMERITSSVAIFSIRILSRKSTHTPENVHKALTGQPTRSLEPILFPKLRIHESLALTPIVCFFVSYHHDDLSAARVETAFVAQGESAAAPAEPGQKTPLNDAKTPQISTTQLKFKKHATLQNRTPDLPPMEQRNIHCLTARLLRQPSLAYKMSQRDPRRIDSSRPLQYPANLQAVFVHREPVTVVQQGLLKLESLSNIGQ
ncbi:unnamed protein product [Heligmosomoides polygyrus]|uniref:Uncharacterized protein n=1 Tax=Heligmosomoides polygyrus TaxID=6339 RepID=A0A3P7Z319_HELPZ|nr:unnamed protein product [Heligmosomoides polygyrus]